MLSRKEGCWEKKKDLIENNVDLNEVIAEKEKEVKTEIAKNSALEKEKVNTFVVLSAMVLSFAYRSWWY